jgi:hypothetical protein
MLLLHVLVVSALLGTAPPPPPSDGERAAAEAAWSDFPGLPIYEPLNPFEYNRSALFSPPLLRPKGSWAFSVALDYGSSILLYGNTPNSVLLDAELGRLTFTGSFRVSSTVFLLVEAGVQGAYSGFLDRFLNWYHGLLGLQYHARDIRPINKFGYYFQRGSREQSYKPVGLTLTDTRLGVGWLISDQLQLLATVVLPTAWVDGYAAHTVQFGLLLTWQRPLFWPWLLFQGTLGVGATPRTSGLLEPFQNVVFGSASVGFRPRLSQHNYLYVNFFLQTPLYSNTGDNPLDWPDGSLDFGWMFRTDSDWEFNLGMTEDAVAGGPAMDIIFRFGLRHGF